MVKLLLNLVAELSNITRILCICWSKKPGRLSVEAWEVVSVILIFSLVLLVRLLRRKGGAHPLMVALSASGKGRLALLLGPGPASNCHSDPSLVTVTTIET